MTDLRNLREIMRSSLLSDVNTSPQWPCATAHIIGAGALFSHALETLCARLPRKK